MASHPEPILWRTMDGQRCFLVPEGTELPSGPLEIRNQLGEVALVAEDSLDAFEVSDEQARRWAKDQLGQALDELKQGIDEKLREWRRDLDERKSSPPSDEAPYTSDAPPALLELVKQLPGVVRKGLSGEDERVKAARDAMTELQGRLKDAGIDVGDALARFPDRLAELRREFERKGEGAPDEP